MVSLEAEDSATDVTIATLGGALARDGSVETATLAFGLAERLGEHEDYVYPPWLADQLRAGITHCRSLLSEARFGAAWEQGRAMSPDDLFRIAEGFAGRDT